MERELAPTRELRYTSEGKLIVPIYDQTGVIVELTCIDSRTAQDFVVWLRKFDRAGMVRRP